MLADTSASKFSLFVILLRVHGHCFENPPCRPCETNVGFSSSLGKCGNVEAFRLLLHRVNFSFMRYVDEDGVHSSSLVCSLIVTDDEID